MPRKVYKTSSKFGLKKKIGALIILLIALPLILLQVKVVQDLRNRAAPESLPPGVERKVIDGRVFYIHQDPGEAFPEPDPAMLRSVPAIPCVGDGVSGPRFQVVYAYQKGTPNRKTEVEGQIRSLVGQASELFDLSAQQTGGRRVPRFVTTNCDLDIKTVSMPEASLNDFGDIFEHMRSLGYSGMYRNAVVFFEPPVAGDCGWGTLEIDPQSGWRNRSNMGGATSRIADSSNSRCWSPYTVAHEMMHNLGAVSHNSPNASRYFHCVDEHDLMCYQDADDVALRYECPDETLGEARFDCNGDDYFSFDPTGYVASHWNTAYSTFLDDPTRDAAVVKSGGSDKRGGNISLAVTGFQPNESFGIVWRNGINKKDPWEEGSEMLEATVDGNGGWSGSLKIPSNTSPNSKAIVRGSQGSYAEVAINVKKENKKKKKNNKKNNNKKKNNKKN